MGKFARFFKADLQMQTPADRAHWVGTANALPADPTDAEIEASAKTYLDRCFEVGLEIIAITDHNLGGPLGLRYVEALRKVSQSTPPDGRPITIFPGFEVATNLGSRAHVVCIFDARAELEKVSDCLTTLGLANDKRFKGGDAIPLNTSIEHLFTTVTSAGGIVIAAHVTRDNGALNHKTLAAAFQPALLQDPRLLAIEIDNDRASVARSTGSIGQILRNDGDWRRATPVAAICSSDCKRLSESDGTGDASFIGKRHTWLKMSEPTIDGLRQAFLDHENRIAFGTERPEDTYRHPRIESITVKAAAFLEDQTIDFSPNLTTLIGGSGSGKSTIVEYLRAGVGQRPHDAEIKVSHQKLMSTLGADAEVEVRLREPDGSIITTWARAGGRLDVVGSPDVSATSLPTRFPVRVLSQREIYARASSPTSTTAVIDDLVRDDLAHHQRAAQEASGRVALLDTADEGLVAARERQHHLGAELARHRSELNRIAALAAPLRDLTDRRAEQRIVDSVRRRASEIRHSFAESVEGLSLSVGAEALIQRATPNAPAVAELIERQREALDRLRAEIGDALDRFASTTDRLLDADTEKARQAALERAIALVSELGGADDQGDEGSVASTIADREDELALVNEDVERLEREVRNRPAALDALRAAWAAQTALRCRAAEMLAEAVPRTDTGAPFVTVSVIAHGDEQAWETGWDGLRPKSFRQDGWHEVGIGAFAGKADDEHPADVIQCWLDGLRKGETPGATADLTPDARSRLVAHFHGTVLGQLQTLDVPDTVDVELRRTDGSLAGSLRSGLSVGQRSTAILAILLSLDQVPIVLDQPEDDIDNEFTSRELVPLIRRAREGRQVIIATHDPNIVVNGNAELVHALEATGGRGCVRRSSKNGQPAVGALDRASVRRAVADVMEGGEEALRRRMLLYGFEPSRRDV